MKIAINATIVDDKSAGLGTYSLNMVRELSRIIGPDDRITVFTAYPESFKGYNVEARKVFRFVQPKYGKMGGVLRFLWTQIIYPIRLIRGDYDVVYHTTHYAVLFTRFTQIMTIHDLLPIRFPERHKLQYYYFKYVLPIFLKRCKYIITVSQNSGKDISAYYNIPQSKIRVIYASYDSERFRVHVPVIASGLQVDYDYLLVVGASYMNKNIERALEAYAQIKNKIQKKLLIVGGREKYINLLKEKVKSLNIKEEVKFLDYVGAEELYYLYSKAAALIFVSLYEGFGIPILEAMASGCPVIASNTSSLPEVCGDAAYYVDPYSVNSIANGMFATINNETLKNTFIQKGLERAKLFSWSDSAKKVYAIFEVIVKYAG